MSNRRISIIIPTLNEEGRLAILLPFLEENGGEFVHEVIIADGGSTDNTRQIAERYEVKFLRCTKKGRAVQMNEGARHASGSILYFLHADTIPPKNFAAYIQQANKRGHHFGCFRLLFDDSHPLLKMYGWFTRFSITLFRFGDQSLFVEKKLFFRVGGFDESLIVMEDQEIVRELKKQASFIVMKPRVTTSARKYKENGIIRLQLVFILIVLLYYSGIKQDVLVQIFQKFIRTKTDTAY